jgi:hypothetical protein
MQNVPYWGPRNIRRHHKKCSRLGDLAPRICALLNACTKNVVLDEQSVLMWTCLRWTLRLGTHTHTHTKYIIHIHTIIYIYYILLHIMYIYYIHGAGIAQSVATCYGLGGPEIESRWAAIFRTHPDRPWGPPSLLYNGYRVFPGGKAAGAWRWPPTPPGADVEWRVEPSWPVLGWTFTFYINAQHNRRLFSFAAYSVRNGSFPTWDTTDWPKNPSSGLHAVDGQLNMMAVHRTSNWFNWNSSTYVLGYTASHPGRHLHSHRRENLKSHKNENDFTQNVSNLTLTLTYGTRKHIYSAYDK